MVAAMPKSVRNHSHAPAELHVAWLHLAVWTMPARGDQGMRPKSLRAVDRSRPPAGRDLRSARRGRPAPASPQDQQTHRCVHDEESQLRTVNRCTWVWVTRVRPSRITAAAPGFPSTAASARPRSPGRRPTTRAATPPPRTSRRGPRSRRVTDELSKSTGLCDSHRSPAAIPSRVIDELMGHAGGRRDRGSADSPMGRVY
jgi:hypothetical protein